MLSSGGVANRCVSVIAGHNITIGEIHTNYAATKKVTAWNLGLHLYDNNLRYGIRP
jgi:hypothetical protein